jgi:hypothetical protein
METGMQHILLDVNEQNIGPIEPQERSSDGTMALISFPTGQKTGDVFTDEQRQLWLVYADGSTSRMLAEADQVQGTFSPDGQWVAVSTLKGTKGHHTAQVVLMSTLGRETQDVGEGFGVVWVRP